MQWMGNRSGYYLLRCKRRRRLHSNVRAVPCSRQKAIARYGGLATIDPHAPLGIPTNADRHWRSSGTASGYQRGGRDCGGRSTRKGWRVSRLEWMPRWRGLAYRCESVLRSLGPHQRRRRMGSEPVGGRVHLRSRTHQHRSACEGSMTNHRKPAPQPRAEPTPRALMVKT